MDEFKKIYDQYISKNDHCNLYKIELKHFYDFIKRNKEQGKADSTRQVVSEKELKAISDTYSLELTKDMKFGDDLPKYSYEIFEDGFRKACEMRAVRWPSDEEIAKQAKQYAETSHVGDPISRNGGFLTGCEWLKKYVIGEL